MEGPGPVLPELVEVGDGSFEVRLTGCFAGAYEITLTRGGKVLPGSPHKARIHPALPNSLTCLTSVNGMRTQDDMVRTPCAFRPAPNLGPSPNPA